MVQSISVVADKAKRSARMLNERGDLRTPITTLAIWVSMQGYCVNTIYISQNENRNPVNWAADSQETGKIEAKNRTSMNTILSSLTHTGKKGEK